MFSPEDIARLLKFDRSKIVKIKDDQNRGLEFYLNRYNDLSQASRVLQTGKARYIATVAAQTSTILYYVNWIYQHRGWKDALNCLRDMAEFRQ